MWLSLGYNIWIKKNRVKSGDSDIIDIGLWFMKPTKYALNYMHLHTHTHTTHECWCVQIRSDPISRSVVSKSLRPHESQHARPSCPSPSPRVHSNSTSIESVMPSSHLILCRPLLLPPPIPPSIRSFPMSLLFAWGGQSTGVSALASFLPKNTQGWSPLEWTGWISLQSKGLSRVFSNTTVQKHQFFGAQLSHMP